jgi:hypothetical protein
LTFTPSGTGPANAAARVTSNAFVQPIDVAVTGRGTMAAVGFGLPNLDFGTLQVGSAGVVRTIGLTNSGTAPLSITAITVPVGFRLVQNTCPMSPGSTLAVGAWCSLALAFSPPTAGSYASLLQVDFLPTSNRAQLPLLGVASP